MKSVVIHTPEASNYMAMAKSLADELDYVFLEKDLMGTAEIHYYMPFWICPDANSFSKVLFFDLKKGIDVGDLRDIYSRCRNRTYGWVCMSEEHRILLQDQVNCPVVVAQPGVDGSRFYPIVRVGVVGDFRSVRKETVNLMEQAMEVPGIKWHFWSKDWSFLNLEEDVVEKTEFYHLVDYILAPDWHLNYQNSIIEALLSGTMVITPTFGYSQGLPHISYERDNAEQLKDILQSLVTEKQNKSKAIVAQSWTNWISKHDALFTSICRD